MGEDDMTQEAPIRIPINDTSHDKDPTDLLLLKIITSPQKAYKCLECNVIEYDYEDKVFQEKMLIHFANTGHLKMRVKEEFEIELIEPDSG